MSPWSWAGVPSWHVGPWAAHPPWSPGAVGTVSRWGPGAAAGAGSLIRECCSLKVRDRDWGRVGRGDGAASDTTSPQAGWPEQGPEPWH